MKEYYSSGCKKNGFLLQAHIISVMEKIYNEINTTKNDLFITERSFNAIQYFTETMYDMSYLTQIEQSYLHFKTKEMERRLTQNIGKLPLDFIIFIDTPLDLCVHHIQKRNRIEEIYFNEMKDYLYVLQKNIKKYIQEFARKNGSNSVFSIPFDDLTFQKVTVIIKELS